MITRLKQAFAISLLVCFSVFLIPQEFVHALYGHTDTHHAPTGAGEKNTWSKKHIHCSFLTYEGSAFISSDHAAGSFTQNFFFFLPDADFNCPGLIFPSLPAPRGPPIA
ncbi:MAG: hypothetical protein HY064_10130 [Bacteroidetes bacterium]|nr:hypothetical protein [Bacteroidota bacterium]